MSINYNHPKRFWDERCKTYGHTGYADPVIYAYDQPLRLKAVRRALSVSKISINEHTRILDVGCGTGTFILDFCKKGAHIIGIDISSEAINKAKEILRGKGNVDLLVMRAEDIPFPANSFDLVVCVTVLQHIINPCELSKAIRNIVRVGKRILILESSPVTPVSTKLTYIAIRTRGEWISLFENNGCKLIYELPLLQIGIKFLGYYNKALSLIGYLFNPKNSTKEGKSKQIISFDSQKTNRFSQLIILGRSILLKILKPLDYLFIYIPYPKKLTNYRILIFEKL